MRLIFAIACLLLAGLSFAPSSAAATSMLALQATTPPMPTTPPTPAAPTVPTTPPMPTPPAMPVPSSLPSPVTSPTPMATPTVLMLAPDAAPQILWVRLSSATPHAGDTLNVTVLTSSNVASVELRVGGYGASMPKTDVGHFEMASTIPRLPVFMSHNLTLQIIARNSAGVAVQQSIALRVR